MFCISSSLPFIHIEDELEYEETLSERNKFDLTCESFQEKLFNPFSPKDKELDLPLDDLDPDSIFYNDITYHSSTLCNYYMEDTFKNEIALHSQGQIKPFSLLHLNARSLQRNLKNLQSYLMSLEYEFTAIGVSETRLHDSICDLYNLPGYNFIENHRSHRSGGEVGIYLNKNIEFSIRYDLSEFDTLLEAVFIEIQIDAVQCIKNVIIGVIYRPPGTDLCEFNVMIGELLVNIKAENKLCYLMGDYNINLLNYESHDQTATFIDMLYSYAFVPLINRPTRVTSSSATLIDDIFTNNHNALVKSYQGIMVTDLSDHFPIFHINDSFTLDVTDVFIVKRSFSPQNKQAFLNDLEIADWNSIHSSEDTQVAFGQFHQMLLRAFNKNFPKRKVKIKYYNRKPWLSDGLKNSIGHKNRLYHKSITFRTAYNETTYKNLQK